MSCELTDEQLLHDYRTSRSDAAFAGLVRRYADLVYSAALRQTRNPGLAEEATQAVFLALARKASSIRDGSVVAGWLIIAARREALGILRQHARRAERELHAATMNPSSPPNPLDDAWQRIEPLLDEGLAALREADRNAVVLHFLRGQTFRDVGAALGFSEEAARKRVSRALEVLRDFLAARGVGYPASTVAGVLVAFAVQPAPSALAAGVTAVVAGAGVSSGSLFTITSTQTLKLMALINTKTIVVAAVTVAAIPVAMQWHENKELRREVATLSAALEQRAAVASTATEPLPPAQREVTAVEPEPAASPQLATMDLMQQAIALISSGRPNEEAVKEIELLLARIPIADIARAAAATESIPNRNWRTGFLNMLLTRWAKSDGLAAATYLVENVKGQDQLALLTGVLPAWTSQDPEGAWQWFQKTARIQLNFDSRGMHNGALKEMFTTMGRGDFARGLQRTNELQDIDLNNACLGLSEGARTLDERLLLIARVDAIPDTRARDDVRKSVFSVWAGNKPEEAKGYVESLADPAARSAVAQHVGLGLLATQEPAKAADWWLGHTTDADRSSALKQIAQRWAEIDLVGTAEWLGKQGNGPEVDGAKNLFAALAARRAPETAIEWASAINDEAKRIEAVRMTYRLWRQQNTADADAWLAKSRLTASQRQAVTQP